MAYSYNNGYCYQCKVFVPKGPDTSKWVWADGTHRIFCLKCGFARLENKKKAAKKAAYIKKQPTLFD